MQKAYEKLEWKSGRGQVAGKFEYDALLAEVEKRLEHIAELTAPSPLPEVPDVQKIENLLIALRRKLYNGQAKTTR